jgi:hypothetical protein
LQSEKEGRETAHLKELEALRADTGQKLEHLTQQLEDSFRHSEASELKSKKLLAELQASLEVLKKEKSQLIQESEEAKIKLRNEVDVMKQKLELLTDETVDKQEKIESLVWKQNELMAQLDRMRSSHDEEMGEMIDVVNDLKVKEDELATVHKDLANQNKRIDELCRQLLSQEQSHKVGRSQGAWAYRSVTNPSSHNCLPIARFLASTYSISFPSLHS